jgi:hypothetical protein
MVKLEKCSKKIVVTQVNGVVNNCVPRKKKQEICFNNSSKIPHFKMLMS